MLQSSIRPTGTSASRACPSARPGEAGRWPRWTGSRWIAWSAARDRTCRYCCSQLWAQSHAAYPFRSLPQMCAAWADKLEQEYAAATAAGRIDPGDGQVRDRVVPGPARDDREPGAGPRASGHKKLGLPDRHARARFLAELAGMCAVMCIGASVLSLASFAIAKALGYSNPAQQPLELSAAIVTVFLALPMTAYMTVRGHGRLRNVVMTGSTVGVGIVVIALLWSGAISASGPQTWQSLFGLICPRPAWSWSWRRCSASTSTAAEHAITALRLDQRRHLRLAQPDSRPAPDYLDRHSILATGRRGPGSGHADRMRRP